MSNDWVADKVSFRRTSANDSFEEFAGITAIKQSRR